MEAAGNESPSTSGMISFELTNGQPYGPHVPISFDDDQYVEYPLDTSTDFPRDVEEEERVSEAILTPPSPQKRVKRDKENPDSVNLLLYCCVASLQMLMEAIMESLKDMKMSQPLEGLSSCASSNSTQTWEENGKPSPLAADEDSCGPSQANATLLSGTNAGDSEASQSHPISNGSPPKALKSSPEASSIESDQLANTTGRDSADGTKATVTVVKNSSGHVMDGIFRRWDRNFFRSAR